MDIFVERAWSPKTGKIKLKFDTKMREGKWTCADWKKLNWEDWTPTLIKNNIIKIFENSIGYENIAAKNSKTIVLGNKFDFLKPYESKSKGMWVEAGFMDYSEESVKTCLDLGTSEGCPGCSCCQ